MDARQYAEALGDEINQAENQAATRAAVMRALTEIGMGGDFQRTNSPGIDQVLESVVDDMAEGNLEVADVVNALQPNGGRRRRRRGATKKKTRRTKRRKTRRAH
jgi:hypothetical protein